MKKIYKYLLQAVDFQNLELPKGSKIISVMVTYYGEIALYAIVDTNTSETEIYDIAVKGTGHPFPEKLDTYTFLGSVTLMNGHLIFHIFYKKVEE